MIGKLSMGQTSSTNGLNINVMDETTKLSAREKFQSWLVRNSEFPGMIMGLRNWSEEQALLFLTSCIIEGPGEFDNLYDFVNAKIDELKNVKENKHPWFPIVEEDKTILAVGGSQGEWLLGSLIPFNLLDEFHTLPESKEVELEYILHGLLRGVYVKEFQTLLDEILVLGDKLEESAGPESGWVMAVNELLKITHTREFQSLDGSELIFAMPGGVNFRRTDYGLARTGSFKNIQDAVRVGNDIQVNPLDLESFRNIPELLYSASKYDVYPVYFVNHAGLGRETEQLDFSPHIYRNGVSEIILWSYSGPERLVDTFSVFLRDEGPEGLFL